MALSKKRVQKARTSATNPAGAILWCEFIVPDSEEKHAPFFFDLPVLTLYKHVLLTRTEKRIVEMFLAGKVGREAFLYFQVDCFPTRGYAKNARKGISL